MACPFKLSKMSTGFSLPFKDCLSLNRSMLRGDGPEPHHKQGILSGMVPWLKAGLAWRLGSLGITSPSSQTSSAKGLLPRDCHSGLCHLGLASSLLLYASLRTSACASILSELLPPHSCKTPIHSGIWSSLNSSEALRSPIWSAFSEAHFWPSLLRGAVGI